MLCRVLDTEAVKILIRKVTFLGLYLERLWKKVERPWRQGGWLGKYASDLAQCGLEMENRRNEKN